MMRYTNVLLLLMLLAEREGDYMYGGHWHSPFLLLGMIFHVTLPIKFLLWDVLLGLGLVMAYTRPGAFARRAEPVDKAVVTAVFGYLIASVWGLMRGGNAYQIYFQLRMPLVTLGVGLLMLAVLRTEKDIRSLGRTIVAAALIRGTLASYFYFGWVRGHPDLKPFPQTMTTHDDSVLFVGGLLILLVYALYKRSSAVRWKCVLGIFWIVVAIQVNNRRLAWISLVLALAFFYLLLPKDRVRRSINRLVPIVVPLLVAYVAIGWGRTERIFAPVRTFSSISGEKEDDSSKARNEENRNLAASLQTNPLLGLGFGHEYIEISGNYAPVLRVIFEQYRYIPHNSLVGLVAFTGWVGITLIGLLYFTAAWLNARTYHAARTPVLRTAGAVAMLMTAVYFNQAYGDMGLQTPAPSMLMGAILGVAGRASVLTGAWPTRGVPRRKGRGRPPEPPVPELSPPGIDLASGGLGPAAGSPS